MGNSVYLGEKIDSIQNLCMVLEIKEANLNTLLSKKVSYYHMNKPKSKKTGGFRVTYRISEPLRSIQNKILVKILNRVNYSNSLFGVGKNCSRKHDHIANSLVHARSKTIVQEDIHHFFDFITKAHVYSIWEGFFKFPKDVSEILTELTTLGNKIPQGSKTGSALASLVFWKTEPEIISELNKNAFVYTRYIDNITISSKDARSNLETNKVICDIKNFIESYGFKFNPKDHKVLKKKNSVEITGVNPYLGIPKLTKKKRNALRSCVYYFKQNCTTSNSIDEIKKEYLSLIGKINYFHIFNVYKAKVYRNQVESSYALAKQRLLTNPLNNTVQQ